MRGPLHVADPTPEFGKRALSWPEAFLGEAKLNFNHDTWLVYIAPAPPKHVRAFTAVSRGSSLLSRLGVDFGNLLLFLNNTQPAFSRRAGPAPRKKINKSTAQEETSNTQKIKLPPRDT